MAVVPEDRSIDEFFRAMWAREIDHTALLEREVLHTPSGKFGKVVSLLRSAGCPTTPHTPECVVCVELYVLLEDESVVPLPPSELEPITNTVSGVLWPDRAKPGAFQFLLHGDKTVRAKTLSPAEFVQATSDLEVPKDEELLLAPAKK